MILSNVDDDLFAASSLRLDVAFDDVITAQQVGSYKPARRNFEVLERAGPRDTLLHVAQSLFHGIAPARAIGLRSGLGQPQSEATGIRRDRAVGLPPRRGGARPSDPRRAARRLSA